MANEISRHVIAFFNDDSAICSCNSEGVMTAEALTFYNSQHRKLGDDCIFVTQFLKLIEVRVRGFAELFHVFRNFAGANLWTVFQMPKRMRELVYAVEPGGAGVHPDFEVWRPLDLEKASCYDTTGGVGVSGGRKPEERLARGLALPWWVVFLGIAALGLGFWFVPQFFAKAVVNGVSGTASKYVPVVGGDKGTKAAPEPVKSSGMTPAANPGPVVPSGPRVFMTGCVVRGSDVLVTLSDGRRLRGRDLKYVTADKAVTLDGTEFWLAPIVERVRAPNPSKK